MKMGTLIVGGGWKFGGEGTLRRVVGVGVLVYLSGEIFLGWWWCHCGDISKFSSIPTRSDPSSHSRSSYNCSFLVDLDNGWNESVTAHFVYERAGCLGCKKKCVGQYGKCCDEEKDRD